MERGLLCSTVPSKGPGRDGALLLGIVAFLAFCRQQEPQEAQLAPAFWAVQHKATTAEAEREREAWQREQFQAEVKGR